MVVSSISRQENQPVFVLHTYPFKETSLVAELLTRDFGRVAAVAKGARRPRSAMRGMLQSFQPLVGTWSGKQELKNLHTLEWGVGPLVLRGEALICGFYLNELLLRLLPREDAHETLYHYYGESLRTLASGKDLAATLRRFELKMLQEMGYAVPLESDEDGAPIMADRTYCYVAERGACSPSSKQNGLQSCQISGRTLLDMVQDNYADSQTQQQSKLLMRTLLAHYLDDKPLYTRQLLIDLQGL